MAEAKAVRLIGMYLCSEPKLGTTVTAAAMMHNWVKAFYEVALLIRFSYFCDFKIKVSRSLVIKYEIKNANSKRLWLHCGYERKREGRKEEKKCGNNRRD